MLTESIAVSSLRPDKVPEHLPNRDVGVSFFDVLPSLSLKSTLKKSSTEANCLAVNQTHAFAAQSDKAAVHVYNLSKGTQECLIPLPEKVTSLALVGESHEIGVLALGTQGGNVVFWELATGRRLSTQPAHLQAVRCMAVDPSQNFLITGSPDSNVLVWSIPDCLSFASVEDPYSEKTSPFAPVHSLTNHRGAVTCLATGHSFSSANFAVSGSEDRSCIVWNYRSGQLLHTFLLASTPLCLAVDPGDRLFYAGCPDGSIQLVDFYKRAALENTPLSATAADRATEANAANQRLSTEQESSAVLSIALSYDGTRILSGHQSGQLRVWDPATRLPGTSAAEVIGPLTNIAMLPPKWLEAGDRSQARLTAVVKPRGENASYAAADRIGAIPDVYALSAQFHQPLPLFCGLQETRACDCRETITDPSMDDFSTAVWHDSLPPAVLEEEMASIMGVDPASQPRGTTSAPPGPAEQDLKQMRDLLAASNRSLDAMKDEVGRLTEEKLRLLQEGQDRVRRRRARQARRLEPTSGASHGHNGVQEPDESTDEE